MTEINYWSVNYKSAHTFYIATSPSLPKLIKVGITKSATSRLKNLNSHKLGGVDDWAYKCLIKLGVGKAGPFETKILAQLKMYAFPLEYHCKSDEEVSKEVVQTSLLDVVKSCHSTLIANGYSEVEAYGFIQVCANSDASLLGEYRAEMIEFRRQNIPFPLAPLATRIWEEFGVLPTFHIDGSPVVLANKAFKTDSQRLAISA